MVFKGYTKRDTSIIKGFGILCIVLHNYFHWLIPAPGENEFEFSPDRVTNFFALLGNKPGEFVNILFSYLGHYGVQLFIFISGFGLAVSMIRHQRSWESFVVVRLKKLYPLLLIGVVFFIFSKVLIEGAMISDYDKREIGYKLLLIHTLLPKSGLSVNGPWWFFGLIFQCYLVFPFLFKIIEKWRWKAFAVICVVSYSLIFLFREVLTLYGGTIIMQNVPGHLPEFCLGILLAFSNDKRINALWLLLAVTAFCLGNYYAAFYPFTFLSLTLIMVFAYQGLKAVPVRKKELAVFLEYFGGISMVLFATHAIFRSPVLKVANTYTGAWGHLWSGVMFLLIAWAVAIAAKALYDNVIALLDRIHVRENKTTHYAGIVAKTFFLAFFVYVFGYFIAQNLDRLENTSAFEDNTVSGVIASDAEYYNFAKTDFEERMIVLSINGSVDITSLDTSADLPWLVLDIPGVIWDRIEIPKSFNNGETQKFEFSYRYLTPFNKSLKGKNVNMYFWNRKHGSMRFENAEISLNY
jgi:peptidoglycan/LPS O-acetylase OafA/YrhL